MANIYTTLGGFRIVALETLSRIPVQRADAFDQKGAQ